MNVVSPQLAVVPLSLSQRGLWFLYQLRPESSAYNLATAARVLSAESVSEIRAYFQGMVDRHPALRTTFRLEGEDLLQVVAEESEVAFEDVDAATWTDEELRRGIEEAAWRPFDLERGPVFRVVLFRRRAERMLVVAMHHIVADFGSLALLSPRAEDRTYEDFVAWQAEMLAGPEGERLWSYWREELAGLPDLDLPADRVRPENAPERGAARWREVEPATLAGLKKLARSRRATLYVSLLAAFQALLHRFTGQDDFAVGSPAAGRPRGFTRTFGYFTNPLVLRADMTGDPSFRELVDRTRQTVVDGLDHQHFPLSLLVERLRPGSELFRAMFVLHQGPDGLVSLVLGEGGGRLPLFGGIELESLPLPRRAAQFDVTLGAGERRGSLGLELLYDAARFDATTAARWLENLTQLLAGAVADPDRPVSEVPLLSDGERQQVLVEVNDRGEPGDAGLPWSTLHEGFERQAERTPEAVALIDGNLRLTYDELNARASALAEHLQRMGIKPEGVVGVRQPRKAELIVSLLGVLKSGAAYLPLDPAYPEERIAFMAEDAGAAVILGAEGPLPNPPPPGGRGRPRSAENSRALAYLIYTSGSTGRPKGVAIEHAAAVRLIAWAGQAFSADELRGVLAATSVSFDLSVFEIFVPLSFGGAVILAENALALPSLPARDEVTLINTVPSALAGLLDLGGGGLPPSVRTVCLAGEPLRRALANQILAAGVKLWDLYGPSEDTTYSTGAVIVMDDPAEPAIGWPVAGSRAYVLDRGLRALPLGIPGELCLGGGGLARGYLGRPELTAERFVPDPCSGQPGERLYRTGDLARRRYDGSLDYLGRLDHQVKIRGFRIELGEVEAALLALPGVREAVVVAREGNLAAYVSLSGDEVPGNPEAALRDALRDRLPAPFVPSSIMILDALPRTPNGKVDRKALPAPDITGLGASSPPIGLVEETLAGIWADLLDRSDGGLTLGRDDRFFDLGGHSLLAARVLARVREAFDAEVPLSAFFEDPSLAGLARRIEEAQRGPALPIPCMPRDQTLPLSFAQQRFWFRDRLEPGRATYNVPLALHFQGPLDAAALAEALAEIVRRHEALRTTYISMDDEPVQRIGPPPAVFPLPSADLTVLPPDLGAAEEQRLVLAEARRPFDLERGPLLRALLVRRGGEDHQLVLNLHHIACDGWSLGLLLSDLSALFVGAPTAEPPLQYADFAVWQRNQPIAEELLASWRERLTDAPVLELPTDHPEPARRSGKGTVLPRLLPADLVAALATTARTRGATLFMGLLAGFDALLHRHTGQTDLVVGTVVAGRGRAELEKVVGAFVNTLALRVDVGSARSFSDLVAATRSTTLAAIHDQALPFERLVEEVQLARESAGRPFPRALLVLQNEPLAPPVLPGLSVEVEPVDTGTARADLAISFHDVPGGLRATIELARDMFEEATVARLWERFQILLTAAAADPLLPLAELPLLTEAERHQLASWGRARIAPDPAAPTALQLFEAQVARNSDALALVDWTANEQPLTFGELDKAASRLAARLQALGVAPGRIVGLCVERSAEMVTGLFAIWKAGGAYLPLDPAYPQARLAFLIEDALGEEPVVVASAEQRERLIEGSPRLRTVLVEEPEGQQGLQGHQGLEAPALRPLSPLGPLCPSGSDPAYVIYTSGTTGVPKGVVVEHRQLSALLGAVQRAFTFAPDDRMPNVAPFSFDIFLFELLAPLLAGGTSVLVGLRPSLDVDALVSRIGEMTRLHAVPALMRQICDSARATGPWQAMRSLFVGGDRVPADLLDDLRPVFPNAEIHVLYGPTEATILATSHAARLGETGSPIGQPLDHAEITVTDAAGQPVPIGVPGEIRIGGAGVARGYLRRPDLNEEKFPEQSGNRVYRSADLARWRPDGVLEFLGRVDDQVKVRGFRIEPGEVEAAIGRQPGVSATAVLALEGRLIAFVVLEAERGITSGDLLTALRAELPEHMVPDAWRFLPELPLTPHGKVNRRALAALGLAALEESPEEVEAPRGPVEETLAAIFADVLGRERVGRLESFFDLGGHSLLAMRVISRARVALGVEIPLAALFDAPTVAGVAGVVHSSEGRDLALPPLERLAEVGDAPLSFSQQRLWFLDRLEPGTATYNLPVGLRLRGDLDIPALEGTLGEIVRRHQALRTTFHESPAGPVQRVEPESTFCLPLSDLSSIGGQAEAAAFQRMAEEAVRPFDLEAGPLFRALLLRIAPGDHLLVANLHHIVSDGWSMGVLVREMSAVYHARHEGRRGGLPGLPELPIQYADWARWQRRWLVDEDLETALGWWREALQGLPERLDLPTDRPRRSAERRRGGRRPVRLGRELTRDLAALARREGATLFMTVLAGFQAILGHQAGQEDLAVGSPVAGRTRVEAEGLIGFFANTLVLRADLSGALDGHELLRRTRRTVLAADEHQHLPFEKLVEDLAPVRELGRTPLFEAVITFEDQALEPPALPGVTVELVPADTNTAKFDLVLDLAERDGELSGSLEYDADLFEAVTIHRLAARFCALLRGLATTPGERVADLPLLNDAERHQLTVEWNEHGLAPLPWARLEEGFERQAARTPDAVALVWREERIPYRELNERADALAQRLRDAGAGAETVVGIALPRTPELIVSLLAVLKAGAAYVPLDPSYPEERIAFMVEDTRAALRIEPGLRIATGYAQDGPAAPRGKSGAEALAYLIYTSGSTGRPKGIAIEHASAMWLVAWGGQTYSRDELRGVLGSTSMSFDMSIFEVFVTLSFGGTLILADDALALEGLPAAGEVTLINTVPSAIAALLDVGGGSLPPSVRTVNLGGEPLRWPLVERVLAAGVERVWNLYGPSEDTTYSTGDEILPGMDEVDIGRPVAGSRAYVTDRELRLQPLDVPGEVYLGGHGVSRGYFGRPALTAERYIPDPFAATPGARLYRTGDRARWRDDGKLEYLGRIDRQVKIRGFRIEPGEIEAVLLSHPEVREAAILARDGVLIAYVIAPEETGSDLRAWLQNRLPPALVPSAFVAMEALPLSPNGKIDRAALARLSLSGVEVAAESVEPPQGPIEEKLAAIWSEVLGQERIGRHDSFFDLGGHSLLAAQAVSRVRHAFGVEIGLRELFEEPTVAALAARIAEATGAENVEPLAGAAGDGPAPLSFAQQRLWFLAQLDPASTVYNLPAVVRLRGDLDVGALERSLAALVQRQESLRTRFPLAAGEPVQVVEDAAPFLLPYFDLSVLGSSAETEAQRLLAREAAQPFDLQNGPVFRALLLRLSPREHQLLVTMHHIVSDGWSLGVFIRELAALYGPQGGQPLPELPVSYRDFAVWQRNRLSGDTLQGSLAFWRDELSGLPPGIDLPVDRPRPPLQTFHGATRPFALDAGTAGRLHELARAEGATLFQVLLAGFQVLLARWSGQEDLAVGTPIAGRNRVELEGLIGFFVNTLVLRGDLSGEPDFRTLVRRTRERFLAAQAHQDLPFEKLVEELRPQRNLARPPFFQVALVLQNTPRAPLALPGLEVALVPLDAGTAKFEIQLTLEEVDGGLTGEINFNRDLYDAATMDRFLGHFATLLASAGSNPEVRALEAEILTHRERRQILRDWNPSQRFPRRRPVHELFAEQAARRPGAVAVVSGDERLTYGELDRQSNALARRLRRLGVGPEERVAICLERSAGMIVGILGILKAGGAYVPIDPEHPAERQALVLGDAEARVLLTQSDLVNRLAPPAGVAQILWDVERDAIAREDGSPLLGLEDPGVGADDAQYVLYTSGSTGKPKGVVIPHSNVTRLLTATEPWFHFGPDDVWTLFFSFAFDFSVWEMWGALAYGGKLVIVPYWVSRTPAAVYELIATERVTVLNQTPSAFRQIVQAEGDLPAPRHLALRWVIFGGEALDPAILGPWFDRHGDQKPQMINMYGITETTVHVTWRRMTAADVPRAPLSPVGGPIPDLQLYVLDPRQLPLPAGAPGEICVGGDGLARGYLRRPDLTAERFIPDPFGGQPGARLYRSGDRARFLPDGDVEHLGRIDFQVKIRGFRIELGEIETALAASPAIRDAVVLARGERSEDRRLIAWVVPSNGHIQVDDVRTFLRGRLPEYMVPSSFVVLDTLPLTANGKLDRRALPDPEARTGEAAVLPRNATEEIIATAWREALGRETVGVEDSFFDVGGHSLLVVQVHRQLAPHFPGLAVMDLFLHPTISALAGHLSKQTVEPAATQEETRERAEDRTDRTRRQRELRKQTRGR